MTRAAAAMASRKSSPARALDQLDGDRGQHMDWLVDLCRVPGISAEGFPADAMVRSGERVAATMTEAGLEHVRLFELPGVHPYVYGEHLHAPGAPTLLLYAHHDVQPAGPLDRWHSPPFEPAELEGRLYARGACDDKAGIVAHLAAVASWLRGGGALPINVKMLVDGEEEVGSPHLPALLAQHHDRLRTDAVVAVDTPNAAAGAPAITCRLRGMCLIEVEVACLRQPLHSGRGGGVVPDPIQVMCRLIASLQRADGGINVPGLYRRVTRPPAAERDRIRALRFTAAEFRRHAGLLDGVALAGEKAFTPLERLWTRPALTVIALDAPPIQGSSNQITDRVRARLSLRTVPEMDASEAGALIVRKLTRRPPDGAQVSARIIRGVPWWVAHPVGPAFQAARRALKAGYGVEPAWIGAGGSIGFVESFSKALDGVPSLLLGIEDPGCNAHSANESLHLEDWRKATRSLVHLFHEIAAGPGAAADAD